MVLPTAPVVPMDLGDDFKFGPTVLDPIQPEDQDNLVPINGFPSVDPAGGDVAMSQLDVLAHFFGTYSGFGFNTIFRPNGSVKHLEDQWKCTLIEKKNNYSYTSSYSSSI